MRCRSPPRSRRRRRSSGSPRRSRPRCSRTRTCNTCSAARSTPTSTARRSRRFLAENAKAKLGKEPKDVKVAIIHEDGPYGVGVADASERFGKEKGLQIVLRGGLFGHRARPLLAGHQAQARRRRRHLPCRLQPRHHAVPAPGARERLALQDAGRQRRGLQPARQAARHLRQGHRQFLQHRSGAGAAAQCEVARAGHRRPDQDHGRALQGQDQRDRRAAALLDGLQPDLGAAQQRAAGRQGEVRRLRRRGGAQGGARRRHSGRRHHPGLRREVLSARERSWPARTSARPRW